VIRLVLLALVSLLAVYAVLRWRRERREDALARIRAAFLAPRPRPPEGGREPPLRTVSLSDGRLRFRVPAGWADEPSTAGAFCARASGGRVLRVQLRTPPSGDTSAARLAEAFRDSRAGRRGRVDVLPGERVLLKHVRSDRAPGGEAVTYCWELARPGGPEGALLAEFAFSVPRQAVDAITEDDVRLLEEEIRRAGRLEPR
jgi:hypothetical protein